MTDNLSMQWKTTTQILEELQQTSSDLAWDQFRDHFQPIVVGFGRKLGLSAADAQDAAQETMISFLSHRKVAYPGEIATMSA
ncbi:MAG: hypothetical protein IIA65_06380 [Planctomycetes bacterium]|nr:hypothetical protein [Planctomycetota bacterium]